MKIYLPENFNIILQLLSDEEIGMLVRAVIAHMESGSAELRDERLRGIFDEIVSSPANSLSGKRRMAANTRWGKPSDAKPNLHDAKSNLHDAKSNLHKINDAKSNLHDAKSEIYNAKSEKKGTQTNALGKRDEVSANEGVNKSVYDLADDLFDEAFIGVSAGFSGDSDESQKEGSLFPPTTPILSKEKLFKENRDINVSIKESTSQEKESSPAAPERKRPVYGLEGFVRDLVSVGVEEQTARDWMAVRKEKKLAPTRTSFEGTIREMDKISGKSYQELVTLCVEKGWGGFMARYYHNEALNEANARIASAGQPKTGKKINEILDVNSRYNPDDYEY